MILFICIIFIYRSLLYSGIRKNERGIYDKYNTLFIEKDNNYDVLFIGSSRAEMHFNPKVFDSIGRFNSFNAGISGASVKLNYLLLKAYCQQHKKPKHIIINIDYFALDNDSEKIINFPRFFPYLSNSILRNSLTQIDSRFTSFYINPLHSLPYTQFDFISSSIHGWLKIPGKYDSLMYKGYQTSISQSFNDDQSLLPNFSKITQYNKDYIDSIITLTTKENITVIAVTSPIFQDDFNNYSTHKKTLALELNKIFNTHKIPYFNYTDSAICLNKNLFSDYIHLNRKGANLLSVQLSHLLNNNSTKNPFFNK